MAKGKIGAVAYTDNMIVFRWVLPYEHEDEVVLDDPQWTTMGCDPDREARLFKLDGENPDLSDFAGVEASIAGFVCTDGKSRCPRQLADVE